MPLSMFDQILFRLACNHVVVLGRLEKADKWSCEECGVVTDLRAEPYRAALSKDRDTADQIDKQQRQRGNTVFRAD